MGKTQASALMAELIDLRNHIDRIISDLKADADEPGRRMRPYDQPPTDPEENARRWGVDTTPPANDPPPWFEERFGSLYAHEEPTE